jgi:hypothetical protein
MPKVLYPVTPENAQPVFDYVPIIQDTAACEVQVTSLTGVSTKHGESDSDMGRLYGEVSLSGSTATLKLYSLPFAAAIGGNADALVAQGSGAIGSYFTLSQQNSSGVGGRALVKSCAVSPSQLILIPTFAIDQDVLINERECSQLPGYSEEYGLAFLHALAMKQLVASVLPARLPHLHPGHTGLAAFVPNDASAKLIDLRTLANPDQLRIAQAALVKAMACEQSEHLAEFAEMAKLCRARLAEVIEELAEANAKEAEEAEQTASDLGITFGTFTRG